MRKETVDIIEDLLSSINLTIKVDAYSPAPNGKIRIETCDTSYLQACKEVEIDNETYRILDVQHNESIIIDTGSSPMVDSFDLPLPTYFHGKAEATNADIVMYDDKDVITPMVYFTEIYTDRFYPNDELIERTVDVRMFFLTTANFEDWKTDDHYTGAIKPMRNLAYNFIETLEKSKIIGKFASYYDLTNHAKFGIFILRKGAVKRIFDDNFSGVEFSVRLPILKDLTCSGFCD